MKTGTSLLLIFGLALGLVLLSIYQPENIFLGLEYDVRVINGFSDNSSLPLVIWCSSSNDDDLGGRALQEGDDFGWTVKMSPFWYMPYFRCTLKWEEKRKRFDVFKVPRDVYRCSAYRKCSWLVRKDGFYFSNDEVNWKKDLSWS